MWSLHKGNLIWWRGMCRYGGMPKYGSQIGSYAIRDPCYGKVQSKIRDCWCDPSAHPLNIVMPIFDKLQICPRCVLPLFHPIWGSIESSQKPLSIYPTCVLVHLLILEIFTFRHYYPFAILHIHLSFVHTLCSCQATLSILFCSSPYFFITRTTTWNLPCHTAIL